MLLVYLISKGIAFKTLPLILDFRISLMSFWVLTAANNSLSETDQKNYDKNLPLQTQHVSFNHIHGWRSKLYCKL